MKDVGPVHAQSYNAVVSHMPQVQPKDLLNQMPLINGRNQHVGKLHTDPTACTGQTLYQTVQKYCRQGYCNKCSVMI